MRILIPVLLIGCKAVSDPVPVAIFPADGQTNVDVEQPLLFEGYAVNLPPGEEVPSFVRVVDLTSETNVPGTLARVERGVHFTPDSPWPVDSEFIWTLEPPLAESRQPEMRFPADDDGEAILGSGSFSTAAGIRPLDFHIDGNTLCLVTSQPPLPADLATFEVAFGDRRGTPPSATGVPANDLEATSLPAGDEGLGVICATTQDNATPDRAWVRNQSVAISGEVDTSGVLMRLRQPR